MTEAYQVLSRKWRPKKFSDVVGQPVIISSLQNSLRKNELAQSYLLTGTRGVGKTTVARIFSKALNCLHRDNLENPCLLCESCLSIESEQSFDVLEIDAASHNSVEDVRQIIDQVHYLPTQGIKKVYILDEIHMLSREAFNALLKTLEDPPLHVVFIFATTAAEKLPDTFLSRCIRFDFRPLAKLELNLYLKNVFSKENIQIEDESLVDLISAEANGSLRDLLSIVERLLSYTLNREIKRDLIESVLGIPSYISVKNILEGILESDMFQVSKNYREALVHSLELKKLIKGILDGLYNLLMNYNSSNSQNINIQKISLAEIYFIYEGIAKDFAWGLNSIDAERIIEVILQKYTNRRSVFFASNPAEPVKLLKRQKEELVSNIQVTQTEETIKKSEQKSWEDFIEFVHESSPILSAQLEQGNITSFLLESDRVKIQLSFLAHAEIIINNLQEKETWQKVCIYLSKYFCRPIEKIDFKIKKVLVESSEKFRSLVEIKEDKKKEALRNQENQLKQHPTVLEAQKIFNAQIEKIEIERN